MYETGIAIAFILWSVNMVVVIASVHSTFERNLNKIGMRLSWVDMTPKKMTTYDVNQSWILKLAKILSILGLGLAGVMLSWLTVVVQVGLFLYARMKDLGAPQAVKNYRWKMKNIDMSFDQIVVEIMKITDQAPESFNKVRDQIRQELAQRGVFH